MFRILATIGWLAILVVCTACTNQNPTNRDSNNLSATESPVAPAPAPTESSQPTTPTATQKIALDSEGLRFVDPDSGSTRPLPFGTEIEQTVKAVTNQLGEPRDRSVNPECGAGPLTFVSWANGLNLLFAENQFVGWSVNDRVAIANQLTTMAGVGIGSTRAELSEAYNATFQETSLGYEFTADDLYGILSSSAPNAQITALWAGTSCNFR